MGRDLSGPSRAVLFGLILPNRTPVPGEDLFSELASLAGARNVEVVGRLVQKRDRPHQATFFGKGKTEELCSLIDRTGANMAICDLDLSPAQGRNLEKALDARIVDRTELILEIFAAQARSKQSRVQVELASLEYALPRLRRMWTHLDREKGGIGLRGTGEKQIESDRRLIRFRIKELKKNLVDMDARALRRVSSRSDHKRACLVGYASAGKSSLLNSLVDAGVFVAERPFSTLETKTRALDLGEGLEILLSDTVGFIRDIPHHLVASFRATLAEAVHADLLLHVVDVSRPVFDRDVEVVEEVLKSIGADGIPRVMLLNKVDLLGDQFPMHMARKLFPDALAVSAVTGEGLDGLKETLRTVLFPDPVQAILEIPISQSGLLSEIRKCGYLLNEEWGEESIRIEVRTGRKLLQGFLSRGCILLGEK